MNSCSISSKKDLYRIKSITKYYDAITVDLSTLRFKGLVRHAVKYSMNALVDGGILTIKTDPFKSYSLVRKQIDFWQVKYEVFGCLKDTIQIETVDAASGTLVLKKVRHVYDYSGISFGIVFSGNPQEEAQLISSVNSILQNRALEAMPFEILISGPSAYNPELLLGNIPSAHVRYIPFDIETSPRIMICNKKNELFKQAQYSVVVIIHCRILFTDTFVEDVMRYPIEMATPAIYYKQDDSELKYLDMGFIQHYQDIQLGAKRGTIAGDNIEADYLHWYKSNVPMIDGGLNVFNKNVITQPPYNNYISWGEAEDVDVCNRLFQDGVLIDYLPQVKCYSATNKLTGYNKVKSAARKAVNSLRKL